MKRVRCPKCDNFITFDETKYEAGQSLVFVCPNCNKQFGIRMGVSKLRETRKEEQIMQAVWQIGHPCLISEILKKDVTLKRNTVAPGIITLTKKGYLKVDSIGKSMTRTGRAYAPLIDQHAYNEQKKLIQCVVDSPTTKGGILNYIQSLIDTNQADDAFKTALKEKIEK